MPRRILNTCIFISVIAIIISACAKISSPSGGPRDRQPPVVLKMMPENGSKNFRSKNFVITFDEYVVLDNINEKLLVSPPLMKKPSVLTRGKNVIVEFEEDLKDSTTYTFYFQDAIRDLNEANILENFQYVFSTGSVIDSLSVTGNVYDAFTLDPPEKAMVLLYQNLHDTAVMKQIPNYIGRADANGYFRIDNLQPGRYNLFALDDADNSKNYNLSDEAFAFMDSSIVVSPEHNFIPVINDTSTVNVNKPAARAPSLVGEYKLYLFEALKKDHYLNGSSRDLKYQLVYTLSLPPDSMNFEFSIPGINDDGYFIERNMFRDTIKIWLTDSSLYSMQQIETIVRYPFTDTLGLVAMKQDTILMRYIEPRAPRSSNVRKPPYIFDSNLRSGALKPGARMVINSKTPIREPDTTNIRLFETVEQAKRSIPYQLVPDSTNSCRYFLKADLVSGNKYLFVADTASFGSIYGESIDSTGIAFTVKKEDLYNKLLFTVENNKEKLLVQLLNTGEKVLSQKKIQGNGDVLFPLLDAGFYRAKSVFDSNDDGLWTTGDYSLHRQPEAVSYYKAEIEIKKGWDVQQTWDLKLKNVKDPKLRSGSKAKR